MALINCPECSRQVSPLAKTCPQCGFPIAEHAGSVIPSTPTTPLLEVRPSWWNYFWHLVFAWLLLPWLIACLRRRSSILRVYPDRLSWERGIFTKEVRELFIKDIRSIDVNQSFWERLVGIGDLTISTAATVDAADIVSGIPHPTQVKDLIIAQRQRGEANRTQN